MSDIASEERDGLRALRATAARYLIGQGMAFEVTEEGRQAMAEESDAMRFLRRRIELSGRLSLIEQAHWIRDTHEDESSSAQPHRFKGTL